MTYYKKNILKLPNKQLRNFVSYRLSIILPKRKKKKKKHMLWRIPFENCSDKTTLHQWRTKLHFNL